MFERFIIMQKEVKEKAKERRHWLSKEIKNQNKPDKNKMHKTQQKRIKNKSDIF